MCACSPAVAVACCRCPAVQIHITGTPEEWQPLLAELLGRSNVSSSYGGEGAELKGAQHPYAAIVCGDNAGVEREGETETEAEAEKAAKNGHTTIQQRMARDAGRGWGAGGEEGLGCAVVRTE